MSAQKTLLEEILNFLTGDIWYLNFVGGGYLPKQKSTAKLLKEDQVCLLSGGMDSLIGAIDTVANGFTPAFVSQLAKGDRLTQSKFANQISSHSFSFQVNHNCTVRGASENSQRPRSFIFFAIAILVATATQNYKNNQTIEILVPENGFISVNIPLTTRRVGSLSTRTTHPIYMKLMNELLQKLGMNIKLVNPYQFQTKGQMLQKCKDQNLLNALVPKSTSCGKYERFGYKHCGRCVPCLVRRAAFNRWLGNDPTSVYVHNDLSKNDERHLNFDDVRAVRTAIFNVKKHGAKKWAIPFLDIEILGDVVPYIDIASEGLSEIEELFKKIGVT